MEGNFEPACLFLYIIEENKENKLGGKKLKTVDCYPQ